MHRNLMCLALVASLCLGFVACDDEETIVDPGSAPQVPSNLRTLSIGMTSVEIAWDVTGEFASFVIWRGPDAQNLTEVATSTEASFTDENLTPNTSYFYQVQTRADDGETSQASSTLELKTQEEDVVATVPDAPGQPKMTASGETTITIEWAAVENAGSYRVYRSENAQGPFTAVSELNAGMQLMTFEDSKLLSGRTYTYYVTADNMQGESDPSPSVSLQTQEAAMNTTYRLRINATWSEETHPGTFAHVEDAHFSDLGGLTHKLDYKVWELGQVAGPGMAQMAVFGEVTILGEETAEAISRGDAFNFLEDDRQIRPPGTLDVEFTVNRDFPAATFVSMIGPSADWFIGCSGQPLLEDGTWIDEVTIELISYDGGVRSANKLEMLGPETMPPDPIQLKQGFPLGGDVVGTFTFTRLN